jgi:hypothetical protein
MKMLPRNPMRLEPILALAAYGLEQSASLRDPAATESYISLVRRSLAEALQQQHLLHGLRTEALFEAMLVSLGRPSS